MIEIRLATAQVGEARDLERRTGAGGEGEFMG